MPGPLAFLSTAAPIATDIAKMYLGQKNANRDRKLTRQQLEEEKKNNEFQRLISLAKQSQGQQDRHAGAQRLLSLRNSGSI